MDIKGTTIGPTRSDILLNNDEYFKYIFKKTEKIVSAVFYTTRSMGSDSKRDTLIELVEDRAIYVSATALETLTTERTRRTVVLEELRSALVALENGLTLLVASHLMREELFEVFKFEIANLGRSLREYLYDYPRHPFAGGFDNEIKSPQGKRSLTRPRLERGPVSSSVHEPGMGTTSRRERVLSIIKDKGQVTIKDVSAAVTDVSEKTIQRELMSLISEGIIVKEGERRWSRYSISRA